MKNGEIFYINFKGNIGSEIDKIHLGIIFKIPKVKNMIFCIPLTSPKEKHFKSIEAYNNRNHNELKYQNLIYIDTTDSMALLDQARSISIKRLIKSYKIVLDSNHQKLIKNKFNKYMKNVVK